MTALAQSLQTVFKIKDQVAEVAEADNNHPSSTPDGNTMDKLHAASTVLQSAADEMLQPMDQMLTDEAAKWDDSSEKIDDATTEDDISFVCPSAWTGMITHLPNLPPRDIVKQLSSIAQQGLLIAPKEKHKGIANKRTIFERLQASSSKTEHDPRTWGLDPVAFIPSLNCCGRVVTIFEQAGTHWLVAPQPDNEEERLRQIHRVATDTYKLNMQVVTPSSKCQIGTGAAWDIGTSAKGKPITNHIASDVHMLPGHNLLPVEMPTHTTGDSNLETFLCNVSKVLSAEAAIGVGADVLADSRRVQSILHFLCLLKSRTESMNQSLLRASALQDPLHRWKKAGHEGIRETVNDLLKEMLCVKAKKGNAW